MVCSGEALAILPLKHRSTMYKTEGVDAIATITEVRSQTSELIDQVQGSKRGIMIQRNNDPQAVLISWDLYKKIKDRVDLQNL